MGMLMRGKQAMGNYACVRGECLARWRDAGDTTPGQSRFFLPSRIAVRGGGTSWSISIENQFDGYLNISLLIQTIQDNTQVRIDIHNTQVRIDIRTQHITEWTSVLPCTIYHYHHRHHHHPHDYRHVCAHLYHCSEETTHAFLLLLCCW